MVDPARPASRYSDKAAAYFGNPRTTFVDELPLDPDARLLEVGCGDGATAAYALAQGKCGWACGIELCPGPAEVARARLHRVLVGDVETMELPLDAGPFDVLLMSEVVEHLVDPWAVLRRLRPLLRDGAVVHAGSPNVAHHSVLWMLLRGEFRYESEGVMDRTHLRWFTPSSYRRLFEECGYVVEKSGSANPLGRPGRLITAATFGATRTLFTRALHLRARRGPGP